MEALFLMIIAASGLGTAFSRQYHFVYELKTQDEARNYCRKRYTDLATIENLEDAMILDKMADRSKMWNPDGYSNHAWIGLHEDVNTWKWSLSNQSYYQDGEMDYRNWFLGQPDNGGANQTCVLIDSVGFWQDDNCVNRFSAICVNLTGATETYVSIASVTWDEAQIYCRSHHTDLASVRNQAENEKVRAKVSIFGRAWIGLYRESWKWLDGNNSTFRYWKEFALKEPNNLFLHEYCVAANFYDLGKWEDWNCDYRRAFICYSWPVKRYVFKLESKTDSLNLNELVVTEEILKQLKLNMESLTQNVTEILNLSWNKGPDGKVFKKLSKRAQGLPVL